MTLIKYEWVFDNKYNTKILKKVSIKNNNKNTNFSSTLNTNKIRSSELPNVLWMNECGDNCATNSSYDSINKRVTVRNGSTNRVVSSTLFKSNFTDTGKDENFYITFYVNLSKIEDLIVNSYIFFIFPYTKFTNKNASNSKTQQYNKSYCYCDAPGGSGCYGCPTNSPWRCPELDVFESAGNNILQTTFHTMDDVDINEFKLSFNKGKDNYDTTNLTPLNQKIKEDENNVYCKNVIINNNKLLQLYQDKKYIPNINYNGKIYQLIYKDGDSTVSAIIYLNDNNILPNEDNIDIEININSEYDADIIYQGQKTLNFQPAKTYPIFPTSTNEVRLSATTKKQSDFIYCIGDLGYWKVPDGFPTNIFCEKITLTKTKIKTLKGCESCTGSGSNCSVVMYNNKAKEPALNCTIGKVSADIGFESIENFDTSHKNGFYLTVCYSINKILYVFDSIPFDISQRKTVNITENLIKQGKNTGDQIGYDPKATMKAFTNYMNSGFNILVGFNSGYTPPKLTNNENKLVPTRIDFNKLGSSPLTITLKINQETIIINNDFMAGNNAAILNFTLKPNQNIYIKWGIVNPYSDPKENGYLASKTKSFDDSNIAFKIKGTFQNKNFKTDMDTTEFIFLGRIGGTCVESQDGKSAEITVGVVKTNFDITENVTDPGGQYSCKSSDGFCVQKNPDPSTLKNIGCNVLK